MQTVAVSVAGVTQTVSAQAVATVVGGGGVDGWSSDDSGSSVVDGGSGVHHGVSLGGNLVGVGVRSGHRDGLHNGSMHNGCGVALDDGSMRDDGGGSVGGCQTQTMAVAQSIARAVGRDDASVGNGAQGGQNGDLGGRGRQEYSIKCEREGRL